jgi:hypothetical protein
MLKVPVVEVDRGWSGFAKQRQNKKGFRFLKPFENNPFKGLHD